MPVLSEAFAKGFPEDVWNDSWHENTYSPWATRSENRVILWSLVLSQYQRETDGQTDRQT